MIAIALEVVQISCADYYDFNYMLICYLGLSFIISILSGIREIGGRVGICDFQSE